MFEKLNKAISPVALGIMSAALLGLAAGIASGNIAVGFLTGIGVFAGLVSIGSTIEECTDP